MFRKLYISFATVLSLALLMSACANPSSQGDPEASQPNQASETEQVQEPAVLGDTGELPEVDPASVTGNVLIAGSSTVYPLSERMVERFIEEGYSGQITIDSVGSGAGLERFCTTGETDIAAASRGIQEEEIANCEEIGRTPIEFRVGTDALAVVVSTENDFLTGVTMEELAQIYSSDAVLWSDVNPDWPKEDILRFSPGTDSGTYDFFVEEVMMPVYGEEGNAAESAILNSANIQFSEDDNVLVQGVQGSPYAIGYFGYAYYVENQGSLNVLEIEGVGPTEESAENGDYVLARPLFLYSDAQVMQSKPQVADFINFYLTYVNEEILSVGYFPASEAALDDAKQALRTNVQ